MAREVPGIIEQRPRNLYDGGETRTPQPQYAPVPATERERESALMMDLRRRGPWTAGGRIYGRTRIVPGR